MDVGDVQESQSGSGVVGDDLSALTLSVCVCVGGGGVSEAVCCITVRLESVCNASYNLYVLNRFQCKFF